MDQDIARSFAADHQYCDDLFVGLEQALAEGDWVSVHEAAERFIQAMERHFQVEEVDLFPALVQANPATFGPVGVMQREHIQMRELFAVLRRAVAAADATRGFSTTETLLLVMQQHNMKEENILYPTADHSLGERAGELVQRLGRA